MTLTEELRLIVMLQWELANLKNRPKSDYERGYSLGICHTVEQLYDGQAPMPNEMLAAVREIGEIHGLSVQPLDSKRAVAAHDYETADALLDTPHSSCSECGGSGCSYCRPSIQYKEDQE